MNYYIKSIFIAFLIALTSSANAQVLPAYTIYNAKGKKTSYKKMMKSLSKSDIVLFGEYHNNPIIHWLQLETSKELISKRKVCFGAEMFEADNQKGLDDYLNGTTKRKALDSTVRLWPNFKTDYEPLVNLAITNKLNFVATNIPRKLANLVFKGGFENLDTLSENQKMWVAPLPFEYDSLLPGYKNMMGMMGGHGGANLPKAQASKDATMAHFILKNYKEGELFMHFNGTYHSDNFEGILWYLKKQKPSLNYQTIATVTQKEISKLEKEHLNKATFIICVDEDMTSTH